MEKTSYKEGYELIKKMREEEGKMFVKIFNAIPTQIGEKYLLFSERQEIAKRIVKIFNNEVEE